MQEEVPPSSKPELTDLDTFKKGVALCNYNDAKLKLYIDEVKKWQGVTNEAEVQQRKADVDAAKAIYKATVSLRFTRAASLQRQIFCSTLSSVVGMRCFSAAWLSSFRASRDHLHSGSFRRAVQASSRRARCAAIRSSRNMGSLRRMGRESAIDGEGTAKNQHSQKRWSARVGRRRAAPCSLSRGDALDLSCRSGRRSPRRSKSFVLIPDVARSSLKASPCWSLSSSLPSVVSMRKCSRHSAVRRVQSDRRRIQSFKRSSRDWRLERRRLWKRRNRWRLPSPRRAA